jgi:cell division protein FtsL
MLRTSHVRRMPLPRIPPRRLTQSHPPHARQEISSPSTTLRFVPLVLSVMLCFAGIGVYIWPRVQVVRLAYQLQTSEQRLQELLEERDLLQAELASLKDPRRIYQVATEQLGMGAPSHEQRFILTREPKKP